MSKRILILDSSQIDTFLTCPTLWDYSYRQRLEPNNRSNNVPMDMGTYGHKLLEIIYKERANGNSIGAYQKAIEYDLDAETCRCAHGREHHIKESVYNEIQDNKYVHECVSAGCPCNKFEPIPFPLNPIDRKAVRDRVLEYTFAEGTSLPTLRATSPEHVEVGFSKKIFEDSNRLWILEGRVDLIGHIAPNCDDGWADHKFQMRQRNLSLRSIQFKNYSYVLEKTLGVVNYIRFAKKIEPGVTFHREIISFSRQQLNDWGERLLEIYHAVELYLNRQERGEREWDDHRWSSCSGKFGYECDFVKVCDNYNNPHLSQLIKEAEFKKKAEWRPW